MKNNHSKRITALALAIASLTLTIASSADQEAEQALDAVRLPAPTLEVAPPELVGSGTLTIDGTGLHAESGQDTDTIDGTGWEAAASDGTETIDGTGRLNSAQNIDLAASGQTLRTVAPENSDDDCEVPAGVNAATSGNCEPATD